MLFYGSRVLLARFDATLFPKSPVEMSMKDLMPNTARPYEKDKHY